MARSAPYVSRSFGSVVSKLAGSGADLPAYRLLTPVSGHLAGFRPQWRGWEWRQAPARDLPAWALPEVSGEADHVYAGRRLPGGAIG